MSRGVIALTLAVLFGPERALAEAPRWSFEWQAPDGCASEAELRDLVTRLLGVPVEQALAEPLEVSATVEPIERGYRLHMRATKAGSRGIRVVEVTSCNEAARAAALLIVLAMDPSFGQGSGTPGSSASEAAFPPLSGDAATGIPPAADTERDFGWEIDPADAAVPEARPAAEPVAPGPAAAPTDDDPIPPLPRPQPTRTPPRRPPERGGELGAGARLALGDFPRAAVGVGLEAGLTLSRDTMRLDIAGFPIQKEQIGAGQSGEAVYYGAGLSLAWCHDLLLREIRLGPCLGLRSALLRGDGRVRERAGTTVLLLGPTLGVHGSIATWGPVRIFVDANAQWLPVRPRFVVKSGATDEVYAHRPSLIGAAFSWGAAVALP